MIHYVPTRCLKCNAALKYCNGLNHGNRADCPNEKCVYMDFNEDWHFIGLTYYEGEYFINLEFFQDQWELHISKDLSNDPSNVQGAAFILKDFNFDLKEIQEKVKMTIIFS